MELHTSHQQGEGEICLAAGKSALDQSSDLIDPPTSERAAEQAAATLVPLSPTSFIRTLLNNYIPSQTLIELDARAAALACDRISADDASLY